MTSESMNNYQNKDAWNEVFRIQLCRTCGAYLDGTKMFIIS